ncbi:MAG: polysaccharide biosynthesis/export family protein [Muribaculum sp.]|nr:polysaccharide biosynthesis/export family protein [Muribaculaceae bacterium]MCM1080492.1 polysaccharide biosynthesis/export family protein [Muribaculum sp.]
MKIKSFAFVVAAALALSSCNSAKTNLTYFEGLKETTAETAIGNNDFSVKIVPDDELLITVTSTDMEATAEFNIPLSNPAFNSQLIDAAQPRQQTYIVNSNGDIDFPRIGKIHVAGMTTEQLAEKLKTDISKYAVDPNVKVLLANFHVNVLGEVTKPGVQAITTERYSLLDALANASDLTPYGERSSVLLIREENGKKTVHRFNLNDPETLKSPYFYLQQNDVVYVEPNAIRKDNAKYNQNNSYKLSVISTVVSAASIIASMVIALTVK